MTQPMPFELTVALKVFAKKRKAAALGKETEALLADWIDKRAGAFQSVSFWTKN